MDQTQMLLGDRSDFEFCSYKKLQIPHRPGSTAIVCQAFGSGDGAPNTMAAFLKNLTR